MSTLAILSLTLPLIRPVVQQPEWIPARAVPIEGLAEAQLTAAAGRWVALVRVLPLPERYALHHAPRAPWQLVRVHEPTGPGEPPDNPRVVLAEAPATTSGWGWPTFLAVGGDGTVTASWRSGGRVLFASPDGAVVRLEVHADSAYECMALTPDRIVLLDDRSRALGVRTLSADGVGPPVPLGVHDPRSATEVVFGAPWLAWIDAAGRIVAVDIERGERRVVPMSATSLRLDGVWNGRLFAHELRSAHLVDLAAGVASSLPAPAAILWCTPDGVFTDGWLWDPVDDGLRRLEVSPSSRRRAPFRRAPGKLWIHDRTDLSWRALELGAPVPIPGSAPEVTRPHLPARPTDEPARADSAAARAAWRMARGA